MNKNYRILVVFAFAIIIALAIDLYRAANFNSDKVKQSSNQNQIEQKQEETQVQNEVKEPEKVEETNSDEKIDIKLNPMMEFSGMKVSEVLSLRKEAVKNSKIFSYMTDYKPNSDVFQIEDGYPWIGAYQLACYGADQPNIGKGPSRESIGILNPELMYFPEIMEYKFSKYRLPCSPSDYLIPHKVIYNKKTNTITIYISAENMYQKLRGKVYVILKSSNARDLGYNHAFAIIDNKSNVKFEKEANISTQIIDTKGYYHRGFSCGLPEGCNNYSPYDSEVDFDIIKLPVIIDIKLWKKYPNSKSDNADLNYRMVFQ